MLGGIVVVHPTALLEAVTGPKSAELSSFAIPFPSCLLPGPLARGKATCPEEWDRFLFPETLGGPQDRLSGWEVVWYYSCSLADPFIGSERNQNYPSYAVSFLHFAVHLSRARLIIGKQGV